MTTLRERAQRTIDSVFNLDGKAATYAAPGGSTQVPCTVLRVAPDVTLNIGQGQPVMQGNTVHVRVTEIAAPARGGTFTLTAMGETLKVLDDPVFDARDTERLVWIMTVG